MTALILQELYIIPEVMFLITNAWEYFKAIQKEHKYFQNIKIISG